MINWPAGPRSAESGGPTIKVYRPQGQWPFQFVHTHTLLNGFNYLWQSCSDYNPHHRSKLRWIEPPRCVDRDTASVRGPPSPASNDRRLGCCKNIKGMFTFGRRPMSMFTLGRRAMSNKWHFPSLYRVDFGIQKTAIISHSISLKNNYFIKWLLPYLPPQLTSALTIVL